jgi:ADP-ribosylglycohydrolase
MLGAIAGDIIGSIYEWQNIKTTEFPLFGRHCHPTDDTILTVALADSILTGRAYVDNLKEYFHRYPQAGYGPAFYKWALSLSRQPYHSWGNGAAMRVSPVGFAYASLEEVLERAKDSAAVTHNHPEGIKGAQATAAAIFLGRSGESKKAIKDFIEQSFGYDLGEPLEDMRRWYTFDVSCQGTVPAALIAFLAADGYEDAVRKAVSLGGDSDTIACITGGIAQAYFGGVPALVRRQALERLDQRLRRVTEEFCARYGCG